jgi:light-regulated signal transduction histidine kinase (bacteriophytochrome)
MTEQVRAQQELERINERLENLVAERTIELTRSNDALRQFAWAASHDLQEPLRVATIYSQWLSRSALEKLDSSEREFLATIETHTARMQRLLSALRQYLLVNDEDTPAPAKPVSCDAVVKAVLDNLHGMLHDSGAKVEVGPLPCIHAAEVLLVQLFQNLVQNAIKYRSDRPPVIRVSAEARNGEWIFSVSDNGVGIDPQYLEYIFGVFKSLQRDSGTGMGLAICKAAVERIGGRIWAESEPGMGAIFRFAVPRSVGRER